MLLSIFILVVTLNMHEINLSNTICQTLKWSIKKRHQMLLSNVDEKLFMI